MSGILSLLNQLNDVYELAWSNENSIFYIIIYKYL